MYCERYIRVIIYTIKQIRRLKAMITHYLSIALILVLVVASQVVLAADRYPSIHPDTIIAKYGNPDVIDSTEYDNPRPPFVTKWLIYQKENVRFMFLADAPVSSPPPYNKWLLLGAQDVRDDRVLNTDEVAARMKKREKR